MYNREAARGLAGVGSQRTAHSYSVIRLHYGSGLACPLTPCCILTIEWGKGAAFRVEIRTGGHAKTVRREQRLVWASGTQRRTEVWSGSLQSDRYQPEAGRRLADDGRFAFVQVVAQYSCGVLYIKTWHGVVRTPYCVRAACCLSGVPSFPGIAALLLPFSTSRICSTQVIICNSVPRYME